MGALSSLVSIVISYRLGVLGVVPFHLLLSLRFLRYLLWLCKEIVVSSFDVLKRVWQPVPDISPSLAWIPTTQRTDLARTLFANSITLTPGTVTVLVEKHRLAVHALCSSGIDALCEGGMDRHVLEAI